MPIRPRYWLIPLLLAVSSLLAGCGDSIATLVNKLVPPVNVEQQRDVAVRSAAGALSALGGANMAFGVDFATLRTLLLDDAIKATGVVDVDLKGEDQLVRADLKFHKTFPADGAMPEAEVEGTVILYAALVVRNEDQGAAQRSMGVSLLPAFKSLSITSVKVGGGVDATSAAGLIASILTRYADNVTGMLMRRPVLEARVPDTYPASFDPSTTIHLGDDVQGEVVVKSNPISLPLRIDHAAWSVYQDRIVALARLVPPGADAPVPPGPTIEPKADSVAEAVRQIYGANFGQKAWPAAAWVAARDDMVAFAVNDVFHQASLCAKADVGIGGKQFSQTISFPDETSVDCTPTRDCTPTGDCSISASHDDHNCSACLLYSPPVSVFGHVITAGHCVQRGNDPVCEASKAAQNKIYEADAAARKFDCERLKSQKKFSCETEKSSEKALCESGKELLKRLARTGKFANLNGDYAGSGQIRACLQDFALSQSLREMRLSAAVAGSGTLDVGLKFVPLDIIGHLTCQVPWTDRQRIDVGVPDKTVALDAKADVVISDGVPRLHVHVEPFDVPLRTSPTPTEIMLKSVNATIACQGLNLVKPLLLTATPFIPELKGEFTLGRKALDFSFPLVVPTQTVFGHKIDGRVELGADAVFVSGSPQ